MMTAITVHHDRLFMVSEKYLHLQHTTRQTHHIGVFVNGYLADITVINGRYRELQV
jgi:hypothetical protein